MSLVSRDANAQRPQDWLRFTTDYKAGMLGAESVFVSAGAPAGPEGEADLHYERASAEQIARIIREPHQPLTRALPRLGPALWSPQ